jgi:hypothetical protein
MTKHGIQVYEILNNGNTLSGHYTNTRLLDKNRYFIENEIARKKVFDDHGVEGEYSSVYTESIPVSRVVKCTLLITKRHDVYEFVWKDLDGVIIHEGLGMRVGNDHIAVAYSNV